MVTDLMNQILVEVGVSAVWELSTIVSCCIGIGDPLETRNYKGLKLTDRIWKIVEKVIEKSIEQQVDIIRCSLVSCQNVEVQTPFLFRDSYRRNTQLKKEFVLGWLFGGLKEN